MLLFSLPAADDNFGLPNKHLLHRGERVLRAVLLLWNAKWVGLFPMNFWPLSRTDLGVHIWPHKMSTHSLNNYNAAAFFCEELHTGSQSQKQMRWSSFQLICSSLVEQTSWLLGTALTLSTSNQALKHFYSGLIYDLFLIDSVLMHLFFNAL